MISFQSLQEYPKLRTASYRGFVIEVSNPYRNILSADYLYLTDAGENGFQSLQEYPKPWLKYAE